MLNEYSIVFLKNYLDIPILLGILKENMFSYNNMPHIEKKVLIALSDNLEKNIPYNRVAEKIISSMNMQQYLEKNRNELKNIHAFAQSYQLSWLEQLQINELNHLNSDTRNNLTLLTHFYKQVLWNK